MSHCTSPVIQLYHPFSLLYHLSIQIIVQLMRYNPENHARDRCPLFEEHLSKATLDHRNPKMVRVAGGAFTVVRAGGNNVRRVARSPPFYYFREPPGALLNTVSPVSPWNRVPPHGRLRSSSPSIAAENYPSSFQIKSCDYTWHQTSNTSDGFKYFASII